MNLNWDLKRGLELIGSPWTAIKHISQKSYEVSSLFVSVLILSKMFSAYTYIQFLGYQNHTSKSIYS